MPLLFSYGTLQQEDVQVSTYGRRLVGQGDELVGWEPALVRIADHEVAARLGKSHHANVTFNGNDESRAAGTVFEITEAELAATDTYESPFFYQRVSATLASGQTAWVYVHAHVVRRAAPGDEPILRALRLEALSDAPDAFGSTYERELARTESDWQRWLSPGATFILEGADGPHGIVACRRQAEDATVVDLMAMWVHPAFRGTGGGDALVAAVCDWARAEGARRVLLLCVGSNARARRFYERNGFSATGRDFISDRDGEVEIEMAAGV